MVEPQPMTEAIFFFDQAGVCKEMTQAEFEAILDGVVGLADFAGDTVKAVFVIINEHLKITSCVFFKISFDRQGFADTAWNIPLRHLSDTAGSGPDLGAGPISLSCRTQCSVDWHRDSMWDPDMSPEKNTFVKIRDAATKNKLCLPCSTLSRQHQQKPAMAMAMSAFDAMGVSDPYGLNEPLSQSLDLPSSEEVSNLIKGQQLHIKSLKNEAQKKVASLTLDYDKRLQKAEIEVARLRNLHESLHGQNIALREQNEAQRKQLETLRRSKLVETQQAQSIQKENVDVLKKQYQQLLEQKVEEETAKLKEELELRNMELMHRHDVAKQLREELCELRKDKFRLLNQGGDKFLERLETLGVSFIVYHPGAGHVSIPLNDMPAYMENPIAYVAAKCLVSEAHYTLWISHHDRPVCQQSLTRDAFCGCKIAKVDVPSQFVDGKSNRCEKHKQC